MINRVTTLEEPPSPHRFSPLSECRPGEIGTKEGWGTRIERFVGEHPILALSAGMALGIALGCLVKRR